MGRSRSIPVQNPEIAAALERVADLLELQEANPFRVRAYRAAALRVRGLSRPVHELLRAGEDLAALPDIGRDLAGKIAEVAGTGRLALLDELTRETPRGLVELLAVPGLGPKRVRALRDALGVAGRKDLLSAARAGRVRGVPGFGERSERALLATLRARPAGETRTPWFEAEPMARALVAHLAALEGVQAVEVAGSFRRRKETVGDLDLLVACRRGTDVSARLVAHEDVARVLARGGTRTSVVLRSGLQVDLRVVPPASFGAALHYLTGSKAHSIAVRRLGVELGLKINEYGVFRGKERLGGEREEDVYRSVGLAYVEPELREDRGELEAARSGRLPRLVERGDIRGDLHVHTDASDGSASAEEMAAAARERGHEYLAIADHARAARVAGGLDETRMRAHLAHLEELQGRLVGIRLLRSAEVDIRADGSLDLSPGLLAELDLTVCAVHSGFRLSSAKQTERILRAMDDPRFHVLAHPTGRLLGAREPYALDLERIVAGAAERGCFLELDAQPRRFDLPDVACKMAREAAVKIAISSDAHDPDQLGYLDLGVGYARRGWLEAGDVLNTRSWAELERLLRR